MAASVDLTDSKKKSRTLFVRNLPYSATNDQLEQLFSDIGPIKRCFVVKNKDGKTCRGFGYVTFALIDDVAKATEARLSMGGRRLQTVVADRKILKQKRTACSSDAAAAVNSCSAEKAANDEHSIQPPLLGCLTSEAAKRTVLLCGIKKGTDRQAVEKLAGNLTRVRQLRYPVVMQGVADDLCAAVVYRGKRDALKAVQRLKSQTLAGQTVTASLYNHAATSARQPTKTFTSQKTARLIVRNLSFKCEEDSLREYFAAFGDIVEIQIPCLENGKKRGFGIVQFASVTSAATALKQLNATVLLGRPIAVDWALSKDRYQKALERSEGMLHSGGSSSMTVVAEAQHGDEDGELNTNSDMSGQDDDDDDDDSNDDFDDEDDDDDDDGGVADAGDDDAHSLNKKKKRAKLKADTDEGLTVFIRNLSFETDEDDLATIMSQFGDIMYCRLVLDPTTEHSKGTAFVKFRRKESVDKCLEAAADSWKGDGGGLVIDSRRLVICRALSRDAVRCIASQKKTDMTTDSRNLHLVRESFIRLGTQEAEGLSKSDVAKRMKVEAVTRQKLRNPNIFVSPTRLCIRNIPVSVTDNRLKKIFVAAAGNQQAKVTECRIMRDLSRIGASGTGKSRGYGFINFTEHSDALRALKATNNRPEIFGDNKRLIVEFSLENRSALQAKMKRAERANAKQCLLTSTFVPRKKKDPKLVVPLSSSDSTAPLSTKGRKQHGGTGFLPSHIGPKIRHKKRSRDQSKNKQENVQQKESRKKKQKSQRSSVQRVETSDNVDKLVEKYRQKLSNRMHNKWFNL